MAILPILTYPAKTLKQVSRPVETVTSKISDFVQDLYETMYVSDGIGLAAAQVGENLNILVTDVRVPDPLDAQKFISHPICLINPEIIYHISYLPPVRLRTVRAFIKLIHKSFYESVGSYFFF